MKILLRFFLTMLLVSSVILCFAYFFWYKPKSGLPQRHAYESKVNTSPDELNRLESKAALLKAFAAAHGYNKETCFLVDMSIPSGKNRFFVYDLLHDSVMLEGLVAHGSCGKDFLVNPSFSNIKECGCSSFGKYKVGANYQGRFGKAFKLYGLDSSNSNAFSRNIVLHAYDCVPEQETDPAPICNSRGCAMTSPAFLKKLAPMIDHAKKPVLLWIFN